MNCKPCINPDQRKRWRISLILFGAALLFFFGCAHPPERVPGPSTLTGWIVYWDAGRGLEEVEKHGDRFSHISCFAYELTPEAHPVPAPGFDKLRNGLSSLSEKHSFETWLTVVNDVRYPKGKTVLKDIQVLRKMMADPEKRRAHTEMLVEAVSEGGFDGLHLDYEGLKKEDEDPFRTFVEELRHHLDQKGLGLEVVLEPVKGPSLARDAALVVVMAYNLHGYHSGPGPRATPEFLAKTVQKANGGDSPSVAIALGGFIWDADQKARALDWRQGQVLYRKSKNRGRTLDGDVPYARFDDGSVIWLEDRFSIITKWRAAYRAGFRRMALWRLGGNSRELFSALDDLAAP